MSARLIKSLTLSRGEKASILAYAAVVAISAGMTIFVMSGVEGDNLIWGDQSWFSAWVIVAGAVSGGIALALAHGWMGLDGAFGVLRAFVGSIAIAIMGSMIAGLLINPLLGVVYGPVLLVTEFIESPWLVAAWIIVSMGAHALQVVARRHEYTPAARRGSERAVSHLSRLSQENLYRRG